MGTPYKCPKKLFQHCRFSPSGLERPKQSWQASWLAGLLAELPGWLIGPAGWLVNSLAAWLQIMV